MKQKHSQYWLWRGSGALVAATLVLPSLGCGSNAPATTTAPAQVPANRPSMGLTTKQKVVLLAGAAAMYYYYNKSKKANEAKYAGQKVQYYRSANGAIYYRDPQNPKKVYWVTPQSGTVPTQRVPASEAEDYTGFQGYNNSQTGQKTFALD